MRAKLPILALVLLVGAGCPRPLAPTMEPDQQLTATTADGWTLPLRHYAGEGPPVLLVHGMSANHRNWDFRPAVSLAHYLQGEGYDVWVPELRGDPGATHPSRRAAKAFTFDDHARYDLPAVVDRVLEVTGEEDLLWVGHSMGGMLLYTALSTHPERVRAGVAIASPVAFDDPLGVHRAARGTGWLLGGRGRIPTRGLGRLAVTFGLAKLLEGQLASRDSVSAPMLRGLARHVLHPVARPLAKQAVGWLKSGSLTTVDGEPWVRPAEVPLLVMGGPADGVVSFADVAETCEVQPDCRFVPLSREGGFSHDYGHIDPVVGRTARAEVFPWVLAFLDEHRAPAAPDSPWGPVATPAEAGAAGPADDGASEAPGPDEPVTPWVERPSRDEDPVPGDAPVGGDRQPVGRDGPRSAPDPATEPR